MKRQERAAEIRQKLNEQREQLTPQGQLNTQDPFSQLLAMDKQQQESFLNSLKPFRQSMFEYEAALLEIETKLKIIDMEFSSSHARNPIQNIKTRLKTPRSIVDKMSRKGVEPTVTNIENMLFDIAGARVVCGFVGDVYAVANTLAAQDDITILTIKDYIAAPKPNGYRSYHMVVSTPIFLAEGKKEKIVEIQMRTIAMDFWASLEHQIRYKKDIPKAEYAQRKLLYLAESSALLDQEMSQLRRAIMQDDNED